ncbi:MAG: hypothetical protein CME64_14145 [Halobacteriovoraceae bacterium]|nr:hypothetical protein [Halobacteriovoraceae bacterium]
MTYDQLVTLESIVEKGSFKAASEHLHKTQPALSSSIKKLELEYDIKLFSRENYRPELTDAGRAFYLKAQEALQSFRELDTFTRELSLDYETELSLSIDAICPLSRIGPSLNSFFEPRASVSLNLNIDLLEGLTQKVLNHQVDFGIGSYMVHYEQVESIPIFDAMMVPVISPHLEDVSQTLLKKLPQIIVQSSAKQMDRKVVGKLPGAKSWFTSDMYMKEQLIENGLGWGRLPLHQIENKLETGKLKEITNFPQVKRVPVPLYLLKSKTKTLGPHAKALWSFLLEASQT